MGEEGKTGKAESDVKLLNDAPEQIKKVFKRKFDLSIRKVVPDVLSWFKKKALDECGDDYSLCFNDICNKVRLYEDRLKNGGLKK